MDVLSVKQLTPDEVVFWEWGVVRINATLIYTWLVMALLCTTSWLVTRNLSTGPRPSRGQNALEVIVSYMRQQIREIGNQDPDPFLPFIGTIFLFIAFSNVLGIVPGYVAPTASLSTATAIAICVFVAVPIYGIASVGLVEYLKRYIRPTPFMLPFHVIGELSRTLALAVRLFGNMMSGTKIVAILLAVTPFVFPVIMHALGLLTGLIQAYIFAMLAIVYIASASRAQAERESAQELIKKGESHNG